ncbi:hypothetical protein NUM_43940 [Actinocatenispora comari]|uniref:Uncharacterized protein n=1 Tax=Actinocatenispora comari TaxID=2807577 RepID=A0A8J4EMF0_9ACTN|nr:hypothetical protein NUM_43940 [Actinocatenispora comari]
MEVDPGTLHTDAPWILLPPEQTVVIAAAYDRVYPGALAEWGIAPHAWCDQLAWRRWLTDDGPASARS